MLLLMSASVLAVLPTAEIREVKPSEDLQLALCLDLDTYHVQKEETIKLPMYVRNPMYNTTVAVNYFFIDTEDFDYSFTPSNIKELKPQEVNIIMVEITPKNDTDYGGKDVFITADCLFYDLVERSHFPGTVDSKEKTFIVTRFKGLRITFGVALVLGIAAFIAIRFNMIRKVNKKFRLTRGQTRKKKRKR